MPWPEGCECLMLSVPCYGQRSPDGSLNVQFVFKDTCVEVTDDDGRPLGEINGRIGGSVEMKLAGDARTGGHVVRQQDLFLAYLAARSGYTGGDGI